MIRYIFPVLMLFCSSAAAQNTILPEILSNWEVQEDHFLPDFSYAGYQYGERDVEIDGATVLMVTDFGALPDDGNDDSDAIIMAIDSAGAAQGPCIILFPPGRFSISKIIYIETSNIVLRGSGSAQNGTILHFPRPLMYVPDPPELAELREYLVDLNKRQREPERGIDLPFSQYSWSGGFLWVQYAGARVKPYLEKYDQPVKKLAAATAGTRGNHYIVVDRNDALQKGGMYKLHWFNKEGKQGSLLQHIYDNADVKIGSHHWNYPERPLVSQVVEVTKISEDTVFLKTPLLHDVKSTWHCTVSPWNHLKEVGIENFLIEFPETPYTAHHVEQGYNAIYLTALMHGWVRNVTIANANSGILTDDISNVTIEDIRTTGSNLAHYSVAMGEVQDVLARAIRVKNKAIHPLSFNTRSIRCVYTGCTVDKQPILDQHSGANHQNLFDNITVYSEHPVHKTHRYSLFKSGGAGYWYPAHGAFSTFWNIHIHFYNVPVDGKPVLLDGVKDGPSARLVGIHSNVPVRVRYEPNAYMERINSHPGVSSLYQYQLEKRMYGVPYDGYILLNGQLLQRSKEAIERKDGDFMPAYRQLLQEADKAMKGGLRSVMEKEHLPPSGNKHDYMSVGTYWWPDPEKDGGVPYMRKDGVVNPEVQEYDDAPMKDMISRVRTLALAYNFTQDRKYADMAVQLMKTWFLDTATRMHPHLLYGQAIKGRVTGRDIGIIDTWSLSHIPDAIRMLRNSSAWSASFDEGMRSWFGAYLDWLWNHPYGQGERNNLNNHGTAYDVQTAAFALFTGRKHLARTILASVPERRIDSQIEPDGTQPLELARTRSYTYSVFNLLHFVNLAMMAEKLGLDLMGYVGLEGQSIPAALQDVMQYSKDPEKWPYTQITPWESDQQRLYEILLKASWISDNEEYLYGAGAMDNASKETYRANLTFPLLPTVADESQ